MACELNPSHQMAVSYHSLAPVVAPPESILWLCCDPATRFSLPIRARNPGLMRVLATAEEFPPAMSKLLYFLATFAESGLSVFGLRGCYEQPAYTVLQTIAPQVEIRAYGPRSAVETPIQAGGDGAAFERLFRYITGANTTGALISMTAPVAETSKMIAMTVPVETSGGRDMMRFFLPADVARAGPPAPRDTLVRLVTLPEVTLGVIRYTGWPTAAAREDETRKLRAALAKAGKATTGAPIYFSYDPPFTIPALRRNEVALTLAP